MFVSSDYSHNTAGYRNHIRVLQKSTVFTIRTLDIVKMYITDLLLRNSKHKSNNVIIIEETMNEICNKCKSCEAESAYSIKVMPLFSSRSFFQGSNEAVYVTVLLSIKCWHNIYKDNTAW